MTSVRPLTERERKELRRLARREVGRVSAAEGRGCPGLPGRRNRRNLTVRRWLERVDGLRDRPRCGRPRKADAAVRSEVIRLVEEAQPERYGLLFGFWTVALLCAYLARGACLKPWGEHRPPSGRCLWHRRRLCLAAAEAHRTAVRFSARPGRSGQAVGHS